MMNQKKSVYLQMKHFQAYDSQLNDLKHVSVLGNAPANILFNLVKVEKKCDGALANVITTKYPFMRTPFFQV